MDQRFEVALCRFRLARDAMKPVEALRIDSKAVVVDPGVALRQHRRHDGRSEQGHDGRHPVHRPSPADRRRRVREHVRRIERPAAFGASLRQAEQAVAAVMAMGFAVGGSEHGGPKGPEATGVSGGTHRLRLGRITLEPPSEAPAAPAGQSVSRTQ